MQLSIITVTYNNYNGLKATIESVLNQNRNDFEFIIVDGASNDGSLELIKSNTHFITKWKSEPDTGIYNAMNKGVRMSTGTFCLFLNSGDTLYSSNTINEILNETLDADFIEGRIAFNYEQAEIHKPIYPRSLWSYLYKTNNNHQASLISRNLLLKFPYDESYKIAADLKFNIETIICNNCSFKTINTIICKYEIGGRSATTNHQEEVTRIYSELIPSRILNDYDYFRCFTFWPVSSIMPTIFKIAHWKWPYLLKLRIKFIFGKKITKFDREKLIEMEKWNEKYKNL